MSAFAYAVTHMLVILCVIAIVVLVVGCAAGWAWFRYRHPFWSERPGPHWHHLATVALGLTRPGIIRTNTAPEPLPHMVWTTPRPASISRLQEYVDLLNSSYSIGEDYHHTFTIDALACRLFAPGAITLDVVTPAGRVVGLISSRRVKATRSGVFAEALAGFRVGIGMIDFLCVARDSRGSGLANHLIAWTDTIASQQGRSVHLFEREGRPAPIPAVCNTIYRYAGKPQHTTGTVELVATTESTKLVSSSDTVKVILNSGSGWDLVSEDDVARWSTSTDDTWASGIHALGYWIVENAYMSDGDNNTFGILVAMKCAPGISPETLMAHILENNPWTYLLASDDVVGKCNMDNSNIEWKPSSQAWTHVYNCVLPSIGPTSVGKNGLRILAM